MLLLVTAALTCTEAAGAAGALSAEDALGKRLSRKASPVLKILLFSAACTGSFAAARRASPPDLGRVGGDFCRAAPNACG